MRKGSHHTEESRIKMSNSQKGKSPSEEHRKNLSEARSGEKHWNFGKHLSEEHRNKISKKLKGRQSNRKGVKLLQETKDKISEANKGKHHLSPEHKQKLLDANIGRIPSEETRNKMSVSGKNRKFSKEHRRKIGEAGRGRKLTPEHRQILLNANKGKHRTKETRKILSEIGKIKKGNKNNNWRGGKIKINCKQCGKEKEIFPSRVKQDGKNFCSGKCVSLYNVSHMNTKNTDIELLIEQELIKRNICFKPQYSLLNLTIVDFFIEPNIVIYCDGDYWHSLEKAKIRDSKNNLALSSNGYKVFRFTGTEIKKSVDNCVNRIFIKGGN